MENSMVDFSHPRSTSGAMRKSALAAFLTPPTGDNALRAERDLLHKLRLYEHVRNIEKRSRRNALAAEMFGVSVEQNTVDERNLAFGLHEWSRGRNLCLRTCAGPHSLAACFETVLLLLRRL